MATGIPELDKNFKNMLTKLPTYGSEVNSNVRKTGKENYAVLKGLLEREISKLPPSDMKNEMIEGINIWTKNMDNLTRHGAIFSGIDPIHSTLEQKAEYMNKYIIPIASEPNSMLAFTRSMKMVATSYLKNKNQTDFISDLSVQLAPRR